MKDKTDAFSRRFLYVMQIKKYISGIIRAIASSVESELK